MGPVVDLQRTEPLPNRPLSEGKGVAVERVARAVVSTFVRDACGGPPNPLVAAGGELSGHRVSLSGSGEGRPARIGILSRTCGPTSTAGASSRGGNVVAPRARETFEGAWSVHGPRTVLWQCKTFSKGGLVALCKYFEHAVSYHRLDVALLGVSSRWLGGGSSLMEALPRTHVVREVRDVAEGDETGLGSS